MDDSGPQSLFVVVRYGDITAPYFCGILQFEFKPKIHKVFNLPKKAITGLRSLTTSVSKRTYQVNGELDTKEYAAHFRRHLDDKRYVAHFSLPNEPATLSTDWSFAPLSNEEFCMVPYLCSRDYRSDVPPLHGFTFNFTTNTYRRINPSKSSSNLGGCVVNHGGHIYYMPQPEAFFTTPNLLFERYDPLGDSWDTLKPFPLPPDFHKYRYILSTAVLDDTILFNMGGCEFWAYNVAQNTWHFVTIKAEDSLCYSIVGKAVVLGNTIYGLKDKSHNSFLALSIQRERIINGDLVYTCSLLSEIMVRDIQGISLMGGGTPTLVTRHLVHLGRDNFCLVQSRMLDCYPADWQPIQLTYMKLEGKDKMTVMKECSHKLPIVDDQQFSVTFCFSLPNFKAPAASKQADRFFDINPFPKEFDINQIYEDSGVNLETIESALASLKVQGNVSSQTDIIDGQGGHKSNVDASHGYAKPTFAPKVSSSKTVEGGGVEYHGGSLASYPRSERVIIMKRIRQQISESSGNKSLESSGTTTT